VGFDQENKGDPFRGDYPLAFQQLAKVDPGDLQEIVRSQFDLSGGYYTSVLRQQRQSFFVALITATIGFIFFLAAVIIAVTEKNLNGATVSAVGGAIVETIAGLNFWLYGRATSQLDVFHVRLERTLRYLLAYNMTKELDSPDNSLSNLIATMAAQGETNSVPAVIRTGPDKDLDT
jgi:hypothetical protein